MTWGGRSNTGWGWIEHFVGGVCRTSGAVAPMWSEREVTERGGGPRVSDCHRLGLVLALATLLATLPHGLPCLPSLPLLSWVSLSPYRFTSAAPYEERKETFLRKKEKGRREGREKGERRVKELSLLSPSLPSLSFSFSFSFSFLVSSFSFPSAALSSSALGGATSQTAQESR